MRRRNLITELLGIVLVGDGVLSIVSPRRYLLAVEFGPEGYKRALEELAQRPPLTRLLAAGQVGQIRNPILECGHDRVAALAQRERKPASRDAGSFAPASVVTLPAEKELRGRAHHLRVPHRLEG